MSLKHYILDEKRQVKEVDLMTWANWLESDKGGKARQIGFDRLDDIYISTVFLGLDHSFGMGRPLIFETMVFANKETEVEMFGKKHTIHRSLDEYSNRYTTMDEAKAGHESLVNDLKKKTFWNCEVCERLRADEFISVYTYPLKDLPDGERNLKYCNDSEDCLQGAITKASTGTI